MMKQLVVCPLCHTRLRVNVKPTASSRQRVKCNKCGSAIDFAVDPAALTPPPDPFSDELAELEDLTAADLELDTHALDESAAELDADSGTGLVNLSGPADSDLPEDLAKAMSLSAQRDYHAATPRPPRKRKKPEEQSTSVPGRPVATPGKVDETAGPIEATFELASRTKSRITPLRVVIAIIAAVFLVGLSFQLSQFAGAVGPKSAAIALAIAVPLMILLGAVAWIVHTLSPTTLYVARNADGTLYAEKTTHILMIPISTTEIDMQSYTLLETEKRVRRDTASGALSTTIQILFWGTALLSCGICALLYLVGYYLGWQVAVSSAMSDQGTSEDVYDVYLTGPSVETMYFFRDEGPLTAAPATRQLSTILRLPIRGDLARHTDPLWRY